MHPSMSDKSTIRPESGDDTSAIHALHAAAFGEESNVSKLVAGLRAHEGAYPTISLVAELEAGAPIGHAMLSHAWVDASNHLVDVMVLSPLGVHPRAQKKGVGTALINAALKAADELLVPLVFLEGNPSYYGPRGFENAISLSFRRPSLRIPENAFQVARLKSFDQSMTGTFVYRDVHWRHGVGLYRRY